jgi:hypothetical protein
VIGINRHNIALELVIVLVGTRQSMLPRVACRMLADMSRDYLADHESLAIGAHRDGANVPRLLDRHGRIQEVGRWGRSFVDKDITN